MEFPSILGPRVFLNLFQVRLILSSECKERAFLSPQSHGEVRFRSGHLLELKGFSTRQYFSKLARVLFKISSSTDIEFVLHMIEAHSSSEFEVNLEGLDLLLCHPEYVQV